MKQLIAKSSIDNRLYKSLTLPNKLGCLLISDKETEKSAAALCVNVGSLEDPLHSQGLAHFLEHMLFMGTTKYPNESEYQDYISKNSGDTNAFTSSLNTNYIFQIANNSLEGALDRFAQFFTNPLFDASCVEREMKAVDSEFNLHKQNDFWKKHQIQSGLAHVNNPQRKFMIGNLATLNKPDIRDDLLKFYERYYSANVMKLIVYGQQPLEQLEEWTTQYFSGIKNKDLMPPLYSEKPYDEKNLGKLIQFVPSKDQDYIEFNWFLDSLEQHYKNCPGSYVSHLIGHEGQNSLLSLLIAEGLASELSCGFDSEMRLYSILRVQIKLTPKGLNNIEKIASYMSQYLSVLRDRGTQEWIFQEIKDIKRLRFQFLEKQKPFSYVSDLARRLHMYPVEEVLQQPFLMETYQPELIQNTINSLTDKNLMIIVSSKSFQGQLKLVEEYFETPYSIDSIPETILREMQSPTVRSSLKPLDIPERNIFLPKNTDVHPIVNEPTTQPEKVYETPASTLWYLRDNQFNVPKAVVNLRVYCNDENYSKSARTEILARLWNMILENHVREINYLAQTAYLSGDVSFAPNGLEVSFSGFSDSVPTYIVQFLTLVKAMDITKYEDQYTSVYGTQKQILQNFERQPPYNQVYALSNVILKSGASFEPDHLLEALGQVKFQDLVHFHQRWLQTVRFEWFFNGNIPQDYAKGIVDKVEVIMGSKILSKYDVIEQRSVNIVPGNTYNYSYVLKDEKNSGMLLFYQQEVATKRTQLINDLIANILKTPFFTQLRTQEQLGYAVFSLVSDIRGIYGYNFIIQSNSRSPQYCQKRVRHFINEQMLTSLRNLTPEQFEGYKQSVRVDLQEKDYTLQQKSARLWSEIMKHQYMFDRKKQLLELIDSITKEEVVQFYEEYFIYNTRVMEIHAISKDHQEENEQEKTTAVHAPSIEWLKRRLPLYPDYYSML